MAHQTDRIMNSRRRQQDDNAIKKQVKIARQRGLTNNDKIVKEPHRLVKHHALDCGRPGCYLCGNPRRIHKDDLTIQEKRMFQDIVEPRGQCPLDNNDAS